MCKRKSSHPLHWKAAVQVSAERRLQHTIRDRSHTHPERTRAPSSCKLSVTVASAGFHSVGAVCIGTSNANRLACACLTTCSTHHAQLPSGGEYRAGGHVPARPAGLPYPQGSSTY